MNDELKEKLEAVADGVEEKAEEIREAIDEVRESAAEKFEDAGNLSAEVKENLNDASVDDIITTNTLPNILNRDMQGRLRRKMIILKIERWIAHTLKKEVFNLPVSENERLYALDISRKNPRWMSTIGLQDDGNDENKN